MNVAKHVIGKFPSAGALAKALGLPATTVHSWKVRGVIPARQQPAVLEVARKSGIDLTPDDFFPREEGASTEAA